MASMIRTAKLFRNGGSRAIRLPKEFDLTGDEVIIKQEYGVITIFPKRPRAGSLLATLNAIGPIELAPRDQPDWTDTRSEKLLKPPEKKLASRAAKKR